LSEIVNELIFENKSSNQQSKSEEVIEDHLIPKFNLTETLLTLQQYDFITNKST
jgi:hypothetical protein